jgi:O-antigen/teichoic acid export membrane protein
MMETIFYLIGWALWVFIVVFIIVGSVGSIFVLMYLYFYYRKKYGKNALKHLIKDLLYEE